MIRPRSLLEVVSWICIPSTVTGSKCSGERRKVMVSSLVFSRFSWNKFSADQLETWSTASCALLCCPFGTFSDKVVSSTYFHIPGIALGQKRREMSNEKRCKSLGGSTLERRREYSSLVECYKTASESKGRESRGYFEYCNNNNRSNNPFKIRMKSTKVNAFKHSFFVRIVKEWNNLPHHFFFDININKFKCDLKKWMNIY